MSHVACEFFRIQFRCVVLPLTEKMPVIRNQMFFYTVVRLCEIPPTVASCLELNTVRI